MLQRVGVQCSRQLRGLHSLRLKMLRIEIMDNIRLIVFKLAFQVDKLLVLVGGASGAHQAVNIVGFGRSG